MKIGASTFWWKDDDLVPSMFGELERAGVQEVEVSDYHPNFNYLRSSWLKSIGKAAQDHGIAIVTVHTHMLANDPALSLTTRDGTRLQRSVEVYLRAVDALHQMGAQALLTHDVNFASGQPDQASATLEQVAEAVRTIADYASAAKIDLVLENSTSGWTAVVDNLFQFVDAMDHPAVKMCYDVAHAYRKNDVAASLRRALPRTSVLHINDSSEKSDHILPGQGRIAWDGVMRCLKQCDHTVRFVYELADPGDLPKLRENFETLSKLA